MWKLVKQKIEKNAVKLLYFQEKPKLLGRTATLVALYNLAKQKNLLRTILLIVVLLMIVVNEKGTNSRQKWEF